MNKKTNLKTNALSIEENEEQRKNKGNLLRKTLNTLFISEYERTTIK